MHEMYVSRWRDAKQTNSKEKGLADSTQCDEVGKEQNEQDCSEDEREKNAGAVPYGMPVSNDTHARER